MMYRLLSAMAALLLTLPLQAAAGVSFSLEPAPDGSYAVTGRGLEGAAALDFSVRYDPAILARPVVARGMLVPADAGFFANTAITGEIRIMTVRSREFTGSGTLALITFERLGGGTGILSFRANPVSVTALPLEAQAVQPSRPTIQSEEQVTDARASAVPVPLPPAASGVTGVSAAGAALPRLSPGGDGDLSAAEAVAPSPGVDDDHGGAGGPIAVGNGQVRRFTSVLERFRDFSGERTPETLLALFDAGERGMIQEPAVALSDGEGQVTLRVATRGEDTPTFSLEKASLTDIRAEGDLWVLTVVPEPGSSDSRLIVTEGDLRSEMPLSVAPPLVGADVGLTLDEPGLAQLLAENGGRFDLNGDGGRDYIDEYLLAANIRAVRLRSR